MSSGSERINGRIQRIPKDKNFGFIATETGESLFFHFSSFKGDSSKCIPGMFVSFDLATNAKGVVAENVEPVGDNDEIHVEKLLMPMSEIAEKPDYIKADPVLELNRIMRDRNIEPGRKISTWSRIIIDDIVIYNADEPGVVQHMMQSHVLALSTLSLAETWCFNNDSDRLSILKNYLRYTFYRLAKEGKVAFSEGYASLNTGLVDNLYEPIFGLFKRRKPNEGARDKRPYEFVDWCVVGKGASGKTLMKEFPVRPQAAAYFSQISDVIFDDKLTLTTQWDHVLDDGICRGRFPLNFLQANQPKDFEWDDNIEMRKNLENYVAALQIDSQRRRQVKNRLDDAIQLAKKRASWNYKTAIPCYYPRHNRMSILLPLALTDDNVVDLAFVVEKANTHEYFGATVYPLDMAYKGARLVCRPDSDWLRPDIDEGFSIADDDEPEE
ncbi:DUF3825 domain-containing protein [Rhizobium brockwellii]|uniref:DUF3825 domain-containing protein n=1 Tax=Rhizobium brockwellii TaxID=3019932 RepID=UPI00293DF195|nr:DUF3825 domain-containing protein [Rhizobium brockwellii]MDV4159317.1 DUF3825 domain-containing protein [Rhizobium brockwellii]